MSPNSSSTCLAGMPALSATPRTISPYSSSSRDQWSDELYAMRHRARRSFAPERSQTDTARHPRWYRGAIVRGGRRGFWVVPCRARAAVSRAPRTAAVSASVLAALILAGCGGGSRQDADEPAGTFGMKVVHAELPDRAVDRAPVAVCCCRCATPAPRPSPTSPSRSTRSTTTRTIPGWRCDNARSGRSTAAPGRSPLRRWKPERQPRPAAVRPPTSTRGRSAPLRARQDELFVLAGRARQGRHLHGPLHRLRRARRQGQSSGSKRKPVHGKFAVYIKPAPPDHVNPRQPEVATGQVEVGQFRQARPSRAGAEGAAPAKPTPTRRRVWPTVERSPPRFRQR